MMITNISISQNNGLQWWVPISIRNIAPIITDTILQFINQRLLHLQILGAIEIVWFASQFALWKLNFYGAIFYELIPSILFAFRTFKYRHRFHVTTGHTKDLSGSGGGLILLSYFFF
eukprot:403065_1